MKKLFTFLILGIIGILIAHNIIAQNNQAPTNSNQKQYILTIGDSNGEGQGKWPDKLRQKLNNQYKVINNSQSGRTVGFDNLGREELNALKQLNKILNNSTQQTGDKGGFDLVLICLGTNDSKACFEERRDEVTQHLSMLINNILHYPFPNGQTPEIGIITPPPYGEAAATTKKYKNGDKRVEVLLPEYKQLAGHMNCHYIDIHTPLEPIINRITVDGVHFKEKGYDKMAEIIKSRVTNIFEK